LFDWFDEITADCPRKQAVNVNRHLWREVPGYVEGGATVTRARLGGLAYLSGSEFFDPEQSMTTSLAPGLKRRPRLGAAIEAAIQALVARGSCGACSARERD